MIHVCFISVRKPQEDEIGMLFAFIISEYTLKKPRIEESQRKEKIKIIFLS
jgi:hypothetical protein